MLVSTIDEGASKSGTQQSLVEVRLQSISYAARDINVYEFAPITGDLPATEPGDHIDVVMPGGIVRQYSIVNAERAPKSYKIGVKRDPKSRGGSEMLHERARVGDRFQISAPRNNFKLDETAAHSILIAGGIGITPIYAMISRLKEAGREWKLHYAAQSRADMAFVSGLETDRCHLHADDQCAGMFLDIAAIVASAPEDAHLYCCGPKPMLEAFEAATANWPNDRKHVEYFTAKQEADRSGGFIVELAKSGKEFVVPEGKSILDVIRKVGVDVLYSCEEGICGSCETKLISGTPIHRDAILTEEERAANKTVMICCAGCKGERLVLDL